MVDPATEDDVGETRLDTGNPIGPTMIVRTDASHRRTDWSTSRAVRWAAYATPLCVLPSALWRVWHVFVAGNPACASGSPWETPYVLSLSVVSFAAAFLTVGLVRPWGEVAPSWVPGLGGRTLSPRVVTTVAGAGAAVIFCVYAYAVLNPIFEWRLPAQHPGCPPPDETSGAWLAYSAYAPLLLWGPLLVVVTIAYHRRRTRVERHDSASSR